MAVTCAWLSNVSVGMLTIARVILLETVLSDIRKPMPFLHYACPLRQKCFVQGSWLPRSLAGCTKLLCVL